KEAVGPLRPFFPGVPPFSVRGIHGKEIGMCFDQRPHLPLRKIEGAVVSRKLLRRGHDVSRNQTWFRESGTNSQPGADRDQVWSRLNDILANFFAPNPLREVRIVLV